MIVFPCKYDPKRPLIQRAVDSALEYMPGEPILVVDSCSEDQSYLPEAWDKGCSVVDENRHYETGALWRAYEMFPDEERYFLLHDSSELTGDLRELARPLTGFQGLPSWGVCNANHLDWGIAELGRIGIPASLETDFTMLCGSIQCVDRALLDQLVALDFHTILPTVKWQAEAMERVWGVGYARLGYRTIPMMRPWGWELWPAGLQGSHLIKYFPNRA